MADVQETLNNMRALIDSGSVSLSQFSKMVEGTSFSTTALEAATLKAGGAAKQLGKEMSDVEKVNFAVYIEGLKTTLLQAAKASGLTGDALKSMATKIGAVIAVASGLSKIPQQFVEIGNEARKAGIGASDAGDALKRISEISPGMAKKSWFVAATRIAAQADAAKNLENQLISNAAAAGSLGKMWNSLGEDLNGLEISSVAFTEQIYHIAQSSGLATGEVAKYANQLSKIPGAMSEIIKTPLGKNMHLLDAAMKVASGTGQGTNEVLKDMDRMFRSVGLTGKGAVEAIAMMGSTSAKTRLPLDIVRSYTKEVANEFKVFGNNTEGAIKILAQFGTALQNSGIGPEGIRDVTKAFTSGIKGMDIAQKAFIASQMGTGSGGLLSGAFELDLQLQEGGIESVANSVRETMMKQFGGRIVQLEEAASSEDAAAQMTLQVQMLRQGPLGAMAQTNEQAYQLLKVFQKNSEMTRGELEGIADPENAMKKALTVGEKLQERQVSILTHLLNKVDRLTALAAIQTYSTIKKMGGASVLPIKVQEALGIGTLEMDEGRQKATAGDTRIIGSEREGAEETLVQVVGGMGGKLKDVLGSFTKLGENLDIGSVKDEAVSEKRQPGGAEDPTAQPNVLRLLFGMGQEREPPKPGQRVSEAMTPAAPQRRPGAREAQPTAQLQPQAVNVNVTTVCSDCQKTAINTAIKAASPDNCEHVTGVSRTA